MYELTHHEQDSHNQWVVILQSLLGEDAEAAWKTAMEFYAPDGQDDIDAPEIETKLAAELLGRLAEEKRRTLKPLRENLVLLLGAMREIYREIRRNPDHNDAAALLIVSLRLIRRASEHQTTTLISQALMDYAAGLWLPHRTKPELFQIENALRKTLLAAAPQRLTVFWYEAGGRAPHAKRMMQIGLSAMREAHSVPHLLHALETVYDHDVKSEIVDILEQIGEPSAIPVLMRLKKQMALTDWPLSRHIGRAIKVIELHNRNHHYTNLLRSSDAPPVREEELLRPAGIAQFDAERDRAELLRVENKPDNKTTAETNKETNKETDAETPEENA